MSTFITSSFSLALHLYTYLLQEWRADLDAFNAMSDAEQKAARAAHNEQGLSGGAVPQWEKHKHQLLFMPPAVYLDMLHAGCDMLHLIYLNEFKHLFSATCHHGLPGYTYLYVPIYTSLLLYTYT